MTDFVDALERELRRAAERRASGAAERRARGAAERRARGGARPQASWPRPRRLLPAAAAAVALAIGLALVLAVRPAGNDRERPATMPPPAGTTPADVSPGARHSKRFGLGKRIATSDGVPVYADIDRWRYCPRDPLRLGRADIPAAERAVLAITPKVTTLDTLDARARGQLVTGTSYATHQCGADMRNRAVDVGVRLPRVTFSASLSQLDVVIARTTAGWVVFDRRH